MHSRNPELATFSVGDRVHIIDDDFPEFAELEGVIERVDGETDMNIVIIAKDGDDRWWFGNHHSSKLELIEE